MVEVFKTNIKNRKEAEKIRKLLLAQHPKCRINFDLEDCDRILRVEGVSCPEKIIAMVNEYRYECKALA